MTRVIPPGARTTWASRKSSTSARAASAPRLRAADTPACCGNAMSFIAYRDAIAAVPSVELSSTTITSTSSLVWALRESRHRGSVRSALRAGTITLMSGVCDDICRRLTKHPLLCRDQQMAALHRQQILAEERQQCDYSS